MKVLLINPMIRPDAPPTEIPIGLGILGAILRQNGHDVVIFDQRALRASNEKMIQSFKKLGQIDLIGIGGLITVYARVKAIVRELRKIMPSVPIVLGGGLTVDPEITHKYICPDFCVHGEGEITFPELCKAIEQQESDYSGIKGISFVHNSEIIVTEARPIEKDLDLFPMPAYDLIPTEIYLESVSFREHIAKYNNIPYEPKRRATLMWSRGCPNQCTFCWRMAGRSVRFRSISLVMEEIEFLRSNYGVDSYLFADECINANAFKAKEFAKALINSKLIAPWYSHARVNNFSKEIASLFRESGCFGLNFGIESGSDQMLRVMKKNISLDQALLATELATKHHIVPNCTFIIGMPGETKNTIEDSIKWIRKAKVPASSFFFATPYPGCDLYESAGVQKLIHSRYGSKDAFFDKLGDAFTLTLNMTDFSDKELMRLRRRVILKVSLFSWHKWKALFFSMRNPKSLFSMIKNIMGM